MTRPLLNILQNCLHHPTLSQIFPNNDQIQGNGVFMRVCSIQESQERANVT